MVLQTVTVGNKFDNQQSADDLSEDTIKGLQATIKAIAVPGKGILAADESSGTCQKRFDSANIPCVDETRRQYRELFFSTPNVNQFVAGIILFEETLFQKASDGTLFPEFLKKHNIVPGIKVDKGLVAYNNSEIEKATQGLEGLGERLEQYRKVGARFAKWRATYSITDTLPSDSLIHENAETLAKYALVCQQHGIVPIVEPEVLLDGNHTIERSHIVTEKVLHALFAVLKKHNVKLEYTILKPSMVISGKNAANRAGIKEVAKRTVEVLKKTVPSNLPTINFLSGGQTPQEATQHLNEMHKLGNLPWNLSFSYARALQEPALKAWQGKKENVAAAQKEFYKRAKLNSLAALGKYSEEMEKSD